MVILSLDSGERIFTDTESNLRIINDFEQWIASFFVQDPPFHVPFPFPGSVNGALPLVHKMPYRRSNQFFLSFRQATSAIFVYGQYSRHLKDE